MAAIRAPLLLLHYAGLDIRINAMLPAFETALRAAGSAISCIATQTWIMQLNNDTNPALQCRSCRALAWSRVWPFCMHATGLSPHAILRRAGWIF